MNKIFSLTILFFLFGCASAYRPRPITGPDGTPNYIVYCATSESCYAQALKICNGKYKIVNTSSDVSGDRHLTTSTTEMLIKCDTPPPGESH